MKQWMILSMLPLLAGCATVTADQWHWLDEPDSQQWVEVQANFQDSVISFQVPVRKRSSSNQVKSNLKLEIEERPVQVFVPLKTEFLGERFASFNWDYWWGGFFQRSGVDFFLTAQVLYKPKINDLTELTPEELRKWIRDELYSDFSEEWREANWEKYDFGIYVNANSLSWIIRNNPQLQSKLMDFMTPLGQHHLLNFGFFVNEKSRNGLDPDPAWVERRWEMAYKILDTVEITPRPGKF